ncbi:uncharacterized protein TNCT_565912 [Trichonephila clavata]|uniref:Activating transcription factor 7-interacting protein Fn3 domain-containing protein n=1 Tax=Trichonephila clavata TaxID=2740835 RepID=A0A8X6LGI8_TRICU|nr:uncharacterized protein TNCT_565912 [Trichonephila clavata]
MELEGTGEKFQKVTNVDSLGDSSSDDFDLDDAIEEFTKEQNKIEKLSDDEIDFLVEEFAEACSSDPNSSVTNKLSPMTILPDSEDHSEPFIEDSKAPDSDNDCLIVEDKSIVKISANQDLNVLPEKNMAKLSPSEPHREALNDNEIEKFVIDAECAIGQQRIEKINVSLSKIIQTVVVGAFNSEILEKVDVPMNQDAELNSGQTNEGLNDANETSLENTNNRSSNNNDILCSQSKAAGDSNIINKLHNDVNSYAENKNFSMTSETTDTSESNNYLNAMTSAKSADEIDVDCCSEEKQCLNDLIIGVCTSVDMSSEVVKPDILIESEKFSSSKVDDSLDVLTDNFEPIDSEFDCFIVKDSSNVITIEDGSKNKLSEKQMNKNFSEASSNKKSEECKVTEIEEIKISRPIKNHDKSVSVMKDEISKELILKEKEVSNKNDVNIENKEINSIVPEKIPDCGTICLKNFEKENVEKNNPASNIDSNLCSVERNVDNTSITSLNSLKNLLHDNDLVNVVLDEKNDSERNNLHSSLENEKTLTTNETSDVKESIPSDVNVDITDSNADFSTLPPDNSTTLDDDSNSKFDLDDIEINACLDDIVSRVCALQQRISEISTQNGDVGAIEDFENISENDENKLGIITSLNSCNSMHNSLPSIKEKFLDTSSHESLEESKKRKLEDVKKPSSINKKIKEDDETFIDFETLVLKILKGIAFSNNFKQFKDATVIKKSLLDYVCLKASRNKFEKDHKRIMLLDIVKDMEDKIHQLEDELLWLHSKRVRLLSAQQGHFQALKYKTDIPMRTVAVNVKIFRECDVPIKAPKEVKKVTCPGQENLRASAVPNSSNKPQINTLEIKPIPPKKDASVSHAQQFIAYKSKPGVVTNNISNPRGMIAPPSSPCFTAKSPNVTVTGNAIASVMNRTPHGITPLPALNAPKQNQPAKGCEVIDLTDEESTSEKLATSSAPVPVSTSSNPLTKVNIPSGLQSGQNVQQVCRQTLIPSLPSGLLGSRVAYIVPSNSGQINSFGRGNVPGSNFMPGANQRVPTLVLRITNPSSVSPLSTVVSTSARLPIVPQTLRSIRSSPLVSSPSSDIVLYSSASKHPAPFPAVPEYSFNPQLKALPPKPSLKGSRSPNGIILSWSMTLGREHAEIQNYQLFAYQEGAGPILPSLWKKVGDVQALPLPMACTLTQFSEGILHCHISR